MGWIFIGLAFMFGASWASFFGVVIERGKNGESIQGRSHCACGRQLKWYENIPAIGWLRTLGRTKCCNGRIPAWYFFSEVAAGLLAVGILYLFVGGDLFIY